MPTQSQQAQIDWYEEPAQGPSWNVYRQPAQQSWGMPSMGGMLMGNQLGSYLGFGNAMNNAMGQMAMMNLANQQAKLFNNSLNTRLGEAEITGNALLNQALANAFGSIGTANQQRLGSLDQLNHPTMQKYLEGNSGVNVANAQNSGALERIKQLPSILQSLSGMFNLGGGGGGGGLLGFQGSGGQSAIFGGQPQSATAMAVKASQPLNQQAANTAVESPAIVPQLQALLQRRNPNSYTSMVA